MSQRIPLHVSRLLAFLPRGYAKAVSLSLVWCALFFSLSCVLGYDTSSSLIDGDSLTYLWSGPTENPNRYALTSPASV
jgi:hypothetical protein